MSELFAMIVFAAVMSASPGPANLVIMSIGMNHSSRSALPFVSGATIGFTLLLYLIGLGLAQLARQAGYLLDVLNYAGIAFIIYLGLKIAMSEGSVTIKKQAIPGFWQGFVLQWLNPKAWGACLAGIGAFGAAQSHSKLIVFVSLYLIVCFFGVGSWAVLGQWINQFLKSDRNLRRFNRITGSGLILVAVVLVVGF